MARPVRQWRGCPPPGSGGFTLVETLVTLGVLMILLGVLVPALAGARKSAQITEAASNTRQCVLMVFAYTADHDGIYPNGYEDPVRSAFSWWQTVASAGSFDPESADAAQDAALIEAPDHVMNMAMTIDPQVMIPGRTLPWEQCCPSMGIRVGMVRYPALLGLLRRSMVQWSASEGYPRHPDPGVGGLPWCCGPAAPIAPIGMADGGIIRARWTDMLDDGWYYTENGIGAPAISTWYGCKGRDL